MWGGNANIFGSLEVKNGVWAWHELPDQKISQQAAKGWRVMGIGECQTKGDATDERTKHENFR